MTNTTVTLTRFILEMQLTLLKQSTSLLSLNIFLQCENISFSHISIQHIPELITFLISNKIVENVLRYWSYYVNRSSYSRAENDVATKNK